MFDEEKNNTANFKKKYKELKSISESKFSKHTKLIEQLNASKLVLLRLNVEKKFLFKKLTELGHRFEPDAAAACTGKGKKKASSSSALSKNEQSNINNKDNENKTQQQAHEDEEDEELELDELKEEDEELASRVTDDLNIKLTLNPSTPPSSNGPATVEKETFPHQNDFTDEMVKKILQGHTKFDKSHLTANGSKRRRGGGGGAPRRKPKSTAENHDSNHIDLEEAENEVTGNINTTKPKSTPSSSRSKAKPVIKSLTDALEDEEQMVTTTTATTQKTPKRKRVATNAAGGTSSKSRNLSSRKLKKTTADEITAATTSITNKPAETTDGHLQDVDIDAQVEMATTTAAGVVEIEKTPAKAKKGGKNSATTSTANAGDNVNASNSSTNATAAAPSSSSKKRKRKVDPNAPKKPRNPFFLFCAEERVKLREELGREPSLGEGTKMLSQRWNSLEQTDKQRFFDQYEARRSAYEKDLEEYKDKYPNLFVKEAEEDDDENQNDNLADGVVRGDEGGERTSNKNGTTKDGEPPSKKKATSKDSSSSATKKPRKPRPSKPKNKDNKDVSTKTNISGSKTNDGSVADHVGDTVLESIIDENATEPEDVGMMTDILQEEQIRSATWDTPVPMITDYDDQSVSLSKRTSPKAMDSSLMNDSRDLSLSNKKSKLVHFNSMPLTHGSSIMSNETGADENDIREERGKVDDLNSQHNVTTKSEEHGAGDKDDAVGLKSNTSSKKKTTKEVGSTRKKKPKLSEGDDNGEVSSGNSTPKQKKEKKPRKPRTSSSSSATNITAAAAKKGSKVSSSMPPPHPIPFTGNPDYDWNNTTTIGASPSSSAFVDSDKQHSSRHGYPAGFRPPPPHGHHPHVPYHPSMDFHYYNGPAPPPPGHMGAGYRPEYLGVYPPPHHPPPPFPPYHPGAPLPPPHHPHHPSHYGGPPPHYPYDYDYHVHHPGHPHHPPPPPPHMYHHGPPPPNHSSSIHNTAPGGPAPNAPATTVSTTASPPPPSQAPPTTSSNNTDSNNTNNML